MAGELQQQEQHLHPDLHLACELTSEQVTAPALRVVREAAEPDLAAAELAAGQFLEALGISTDSESLRGTPGGWPAPTPNCSAPAPST